MGISRFCSLKIYARVKIMIGSCSFRITGIEAGCYEIGESQLFAAKFSADSPIVHDNYSIAQPDQLFIITAVKNNRCAGFLEMVKQVRKFTLSADIDAFGWVIQ